MPWEIVENGPTYYDAPRMKAANVMMSADGYSGGMESMRRIVRRYSVRVKYLVGKGSSRNQKHPAAHKANRVFDI